MEQNKNLKVVEKQQEELNWTTGLLVTAQKRRWYGKMTIEFKNGFIDIIRNEETLKPPKEPE